MASSAGKNDSAGIGDAYWYEWTIGLKYVVAMLREDSGILSVTLQETGVKGLDDVVVRYSDGAARLIQVKHTRVDASLTFGDLVASVEGEESPLKTFAECWASAKATVQGPCEAWLVTNRVAGTRYATAKGNDDTKRRRPPLDRFLETLSVELATATTLDGISLPLEWRHAWEAEWLPQLDGLQSDAEKVSFLQSFKVEWAEAGLAELKQELIEDLKNAFRVEESVASQLLWRLDGELREWATSSRGPHEAIDLERAYGVLALARETSFGDHALAPPAPFFASREQVLERTTQLLDDANSRVVFLSGEPGSGKTAVVSALANRRLPVLDLRYHAYRPVTPENQLLPADAGVTATSRALWSDLLLQLRKLATGRTAELRVPVYAGKLSTDMLRAEVLRIADAIGAARGKPVVIAIDGIDHAARAGSALDSLLSSLVPPESVPSNVVFLIAGQPADGYPQYPLWLRTPAAGVASVALPRIDQGDTESLVAARMPGLASEAQASVAREILQACDGHTLASVFAVEEAARCGDDLEQFAEVLKRRQIANGIASYYHQIWSAVSNRHGLGIPTMTRVAACLALSPQRLSDEVLRCVMPGPSEVSQWRDVLDGLKPLVVEDEGGYRVFHNDVRVFLLELVRPNHRVYSECASAIADHILAAADPRPRHEAAQQLLGVCRRFEDQARLFTPAYVIEGHVVGQSLEELTEQALVAVAALTRIRPDWDVVHGVVCGLQTLTQLRASLDWRHAEDDTQARLGALGVAPVRQAERRVAESEHWSLSVVSSALRDVLWLAAVGHGERATAAFRRWFDGLSPAEILSGARDSGNADTSRRTAGQLLGRASVITRTRLPVSESDEEVAKESEAAYTSGLLQGLLDVESPRLFRRVLRRRSYFYEVDLDELLRELVDRRDWRRLGLALHSLGTNAGRFSMSLRIVAGAAAVLTGTPRLRRAWVDSLVNEKEGAIAAAMESSEPSGDGARGRLALMATLAFVLGHEEVSRDCSAIRQDLDTAYHRVQRDDRTDTVFAQVVFAAAWLGRRVRLAARSGQSLGDPDELSRILRALLGGGHGEREFPPSGFGLVAEAVVAGIADVAERDPELARVVLEAFLVRMDAKGGIDVFLETGWRILVRHGHATDLLAFAESWVGVDGHAWTQAAADRYDSVTRICALLREIGEEKMAEGARDHLRWATVGYTGHKEYSIHEPLEWFQALSRTGTNHWRGPGLDLLAVSAEASRVGDNRLAGSVESEVVASACAEGPEALDELLRASHPVLAPGDYAVLHGLQEFLGRSELAERDLLAVWCFATGQLNWMEHSDGEQICRIREAILRVARLRQFSGLEERMEHIAPAEYSLEADDRSQVPPRDRERQRDLAPDATLSVLSEAVAEASGERMSDWGRVAELLQQIANDRPSNTNDAVDLVWDALCRSPTRWMWHMESRDDVYAVIFPFLSSTRRWDAVQTAVGRLSQDVPAYRVSTIASNLDCLCLANARLAGPNALRAGLERWVATHRTWIEGAGRLRRLQAARLGSPRTAGGWGEVFMLNLLRLLEFDDQGSVQSALRGIYRLVAHAGASLDATLVAVDAANQEVRRRFMLIAEALAMLSSTDGLERWLGQQLDSEELDFALSAWLALKARVRTQGGIVRGWPPPAERGRHRTVAQVVAPPLMRPPTSKGLHKTASRASDSILQFLQEACKDDCMDVVVDYYATERTQPIPDGSPPRHWRRNVGDLMIGRMPELDRLMVCLRRHERDGRFAQASLVRLAQALTPAVDPHVLLSTPLPLKSECEWPIDSALEKRLESGGELHLALAQLLEEDMPKGHCLIAGSVRTHSRKWDVAVHVDHVVWGMPTVAREQRCFVLNGRSSLSFDIAELIVRGGGVGHEWLTYRVGGLLVFVDGSMSHFPSRLWNDCFGWAPCADDPLKWVRDSRPVARFGKRSGPRRQTYGGDFVYRQPRLERWTCLRSEWERVVSLLPREPVRRYEIESAPVSTLG